MENDELEELETGIEGIEKEELEELEITGIAGIEKLELDDEAAKLIPVSWLCLKNMNTNARKIYVRSKGTRRVCLRRRDRAISKRGKLSTRLQASKSWN